MKLNMYSVWHNHLYCLYYWGRNW